MANEQQLKIGIILGSTRPNRNGEAVAKWVHELARKRGDADYELVDIKDFDLPLLDEPIPPSQGKYSQPHTKKWAEKIDAFDAFVFVTPEYNHSTSGALKNALDFLYKEWNNKAAAFVGYGSAGGVRAVEHLRLIMAELQIADVRAQVALSLATDFENYSTFKPAAQHERTVKTMLDQLLAWGTAMRNVRRDARRAAA
jgi:NAD(P)H-dependent FMN reductase